MTSRKILFMSLALAGAVLVSACGGGFGPSASAVRGDGSDAAAGLSRSQYRLGPGDQLRIIVFGEEDLSGEFFVGGSGQVSLPLVGEIRAKDRTVREFQRAFEEALTGGYLKDPRVSAEVLNFRPFYILGEVEAPGEYPYAAGLTVLKAVATAEGFTYRANTRRVFIMRAGEEGEIQSPLTTETPVYPGDTIRIVERFF